MYRYRAEILEELSSHGVRPLSTTPPQRIRDFVRDLYRWEIRKLRDTLLARAFPRHEYADRVIALRRRYVLLSVPLDQWTEPSPAGTDRPDPP
jgi:hypothetical protein